MATFCVQFFLTSLAHLLHFAIAEGEPKALKQETSHLIDNALMRSRRPPRAHVKTMLSVKSLEDGEGANESAQIPCDSPISQVRGLDALKVSKYYPRGAVYVKVTPRDTARFFIS